MKNVGVFSVDWMLFGPVFVLIVISLATLFSINTNYFINQTIYIFMSLVVFFVLSHSHYRTLEQYGSIIYIAALVVFVFVLFLGFESRGAVRWVDIFGFRIQFSEIFKPLLLISLAGFLKDAKRTSFTSLLTSFVLLIPVFFLIFKQPDLGSALLYTVTFIATVMVFGYPLRWFIAGFLAVGALVPVFWSLLQGYQKDRVTAFLRPESDPLGMSYNAMQALIAVGSGAFFGKGLGQGTQSVLRFLPERHTDFMFATITESFGFFGGTIILVCFAVLLYRIYVLSGMVDDPFRKIFCIGAFFLLLSQFFVNVGMNIGLLPIVGVTLPFVSYGGSSVMSSFMLLGLLSSFSFELKDRPVLEIR